MRKTYKKPNIYKVSMGSECMTPVVLSKQSIGEDVDPIGGGGKVDDEGDAKFFYHSFYGMRICGMKNSSRFHSNLSHQNT